MSRRRFLKASVLAGAAAAGAAGAERRPRSEGASGRARNVIFMAVDGMSIGTLSLAELHARRVHGRSLHWAGLLKREGVRRALCDTSPLGGGVTDSAAAASAWGSGVLVKNEAVNWTPAGERPRPLLVRARAGGLATGLVTTTRITHATPAGFIANVPHRDKEREIAEQIVDRRVDVALGGGAKYFGEDLLKRRGGRVVRTRAELLAAEAGEERLLGLFAESHMGYEIERDEKEPTLAEMTRVALARLSRGGRGFVCQIEGGRVDHAAHNSDAAALLADMLAFDAALGEALAFAGGREDTLLIVTTDHGTGNPGLTYYAEESLRKFERVSKARRSFEWVAEEMKRRAVRDGAGIREIVEFATGLALDEQELAMLLRLSRGERVHPFEAFNGLYGVLGGILSKHCAVAFSTPHHTADLVEVTAAGPGSERVGGVIANTELHVVVCAALELAVV